MPSIIITLYFGEVSFIRVKPFLVWSMCNLCCFHLLTVLVVRGNTRGCVRGWSVYNQLVQSIYRWTHHKLQQKVFRRIQRHPLSKVRWRIPLTCLVQSRIIQRCLNFHCEKNVNLVLIFRCHGWITEHICQFPSIRHHSRELVMSWCRVLVSLLSLPYVFCSKIRK